MKKSHFVLDASTTLSWCFSDEATPQTAQLLANLEHATAFVPSIWPLEVGNILLNAQRKNRIKYADITEFLALLNKLTIEVDEETANNGFHEILQLAFSMKLTTYDSSYLELALRLGIPLATKDKLLSNAAVELGVEVI